MVTMTKRNRQSGAALVLVLWLVVLLSVIAGSHARNARIETQLAFNQLNGASARMLAESGLNRAVLELLVTSPDQRWQFDGTVYPVEFETGKVRISIRNAAGLVDLNSADRSVLRALLKLQEMSEEKRDSLVDTILDWRDADDLRRLNGAEDIDYRFAGLDYGTPDRGFKTIDELRYLLGMTKSIFDGMAPYLTVDSGLGRVVSQFAPAELVEMLSGKTLGGTTNGEEEIDPISEDESFGDEAESGTESSAYHILVKAVGNGEAVAFIEVVVILSPYIEQPYTVLSWRERATDQGIPDA